jgi:hypothetical protein
MVVVKEPVAPLPLNTSHLGVKVTPTLNVPAAVAAIDWEAKTDATAVKPKANFRNMMNFLLNVGERPSPPSAKNIYFPCLGMWLDAR